MEHRITLALGKSAQVQPEPLETGDGLDAACAGVDKLFLITSNGETETARGLNAVKAATAAGVKHIVFLSVGNPAKEPAVPHYRAKLPIEEAIRNSGDGPDLWISEGDPPDWPFRVLDMGVPLRNFLIAWITFDGDLTGALIMVNKEGGDFVAEDGEVVSALGRGVAEAIQNIRLYQELRDGRA